MPILDAHHATLATLRDVEGVFASFWAAETGQILATDMAIGFDQSVFEEISPRISRLRDAFRGDDDELQGCVMRFAEHKVVVRALEKSILCVIADSMVNMQALNMAASIVVRKLEQVPLPEIVSASVPPPPSVRRSSRT